ncbi:hypothetical protein TNCV_1647301 [Trichonephila clavipes]|nr:hypothetical protein TNCV_1647301 [Trichonephila clavipes]
MTKLIRLGIESNRDWMTFKGTDDPAAARRLQLHSSSTVGTAVSRRLDLRAQSQFCSVRRRHLLSYKLSQFLTQDM